MEEEKTGISSAAKKVASSILDKHGNPFQTWQDIQEGKEGTYDDGAISQRVHVSPSKIETALTFWKNILFSTTIEDGGKARQLNGREAYELGTEAGATALKKKMDKAPYIAMCNIMALEGIRMMGDQMPTTTSIANIGFASEREQEVCDFWHRTFAPTSFQADWAWNAALSVMAGEPHSTRELLDDYESQIP